MRDGQPVRRLVLKAWEPADPMAPGTWSFTAVWPGGDAEGRRIRIAVARRGRIVARAEAVIRTWAMPSGMKNK